MNALDDIVPLAERPQGGSARSDRCHRAGPSGSARPRCSSLRMRPIMAVSALPPGGPLPAAGRRCPHAGGLGRQVPIKPGPAIRANLSFETTANVEIASWAELQGDKLAGTSAQALADVIPRYDEVAAIVGDTSNDHVDVGVVRYSSDRPRPSRASFQGLARPASSDPA